MQDRWIANCEFSQQNFHSNRHIVIWHFSIEVINLVYSSPFAIFQLWSSSFLRPRLRILSVPFCDCACQSQSSPKLGQVELESHRLKEQILDVEQFLRAPKSIELFCDVTDWSWKLAIHIYHTIISSASKNSSKICKSNILKIRRGDLLLFIWSWLGIDDAKNCSTYRFLLRLPRSHNTCK